MWTKRQGHLLREKRRHCWRCEENEVFLKQSLRRIGKGFDQGDTGDMPSNTEDWLKVGGQEFRPSPRSIMASVFIQPHSFPRLGEAHRQGPALRHSHTRLPSPGHQGPLIWWHSTGNRQHLHVANGCDKRTEAQGRVDYYQERWFRK